MEVFQDHIWFPPRLLYVGKKVCIGSKWVIPHKKKIKKIKKILNESNGHECNVCPWEESPMRR